VNRPPPAWLWVVALVPMLVLGVLRWSAGPGIGAEDYAQYEMHARALARGLPYRDTGYLPSPLNAGHGPGAFPPGVPAVLAVAYRIGGERPATTRTAMMALSVAFFLISGLYFAAAGEPWLGLGVTLLVGLSPYVVRYSNLAQSDLPLCMAVWLVLLLADGAAVWSWRRAAAITVVGFAALSFRVMGAMIVPVMLIVAAIRWRDLRWKGLIPPLVWAVSGAVGVVVMGASSVARDPSFVFEVLGNLTDRWLFYRIGAGEALTRPFPWEQANHLYQVVGLLICAGGLFLWYRTSWHRAAAVFSAVYLATLLVLPFTAPRYMWPLFPLVLMGFLKGVSFLIGRLRPATAPIPATLALGAVIAVMSASVIGVSPPPGWFATQPGAVELFGEVRRLNADAPMRVSFARPRVLAQQTGVRSMPLINRPPDVVEGELNRQCITHVIIGSLGLRVEHDKANQAMVTELAPDFLPVWSSTDFQIYRFLALRPDNCPPTIRRAAAAQELRH